VPDLARSPVAICSRTTGAEAVSPVGKPDADGDIVRGSRHYHGRTLGPTTVWDCPACGMKNEGRTPEQGCAHCGAGDPTKSKAGVEPTAAAPVGRELTTPRTASTPVTRTVGIPDAPRPSVEPQLIRVLRLIEYLIKPGENADITLRRSLVGRMDMSWGTLTGTIVDSLDDRQEDLLRLARRQPGVWVSNTTAMEQADQQDKGHGGMVPGSAHLIPSQYAQVGTVKFNPFAAAAHERERKSMDMPQTGPAFTADDAAIAKNIVRLWGLKLAHTFALALSQIAPELEANMEPEKFITSAECLRLANALMQLIPTEWAGDAPLEPPPDGPTA